MLNISDKQINKDINHSVHRRNVILHLLLLVMPISPDISDLMDYLLVTIVYMHRMGHEVKKIKNIFFL
jgi:hypothetical protein